MGAVSIDGGAETTIDFYAATRGGDVLLWTSPVLASGNHTFKLRATGTKNTASTDVYIAVNRGDVIAATATPTPTPTPGPVACHLYTPTSTIPTGYGAPWDVFSANELLISATCQNLADATLDFGRGLSTQYIYNTGYHYHTGLSGWMPVTLTSAEALISNAWYSRTATAMLTGMDLTNTTHYALGYLCTWTGSQWQCGCRDSACTQSYWQIQSFRR